MASRKPSRAEREDRRAMLRLMAIGGVTLAVLGGGVVGMVALSAPPALEGVETLAVRLDAAGLQAFTHRLTGVGDPDVLVVGSSDCVHCQRFVSEGMARFVEEAEKNGLVVDYLPLSTGPGSLVSAQALGCFAGGSNPVAAVQATYTLSKEVGAGLSAEDVPTRLEELMAQAGVSGDTQSCWTGADPEGMAARSKAIVSAMSLQGTPGFYIATAADPGTIRMFSGYPGVDGVIRQMLNARDS